MYTEISFGLIQEEEDVENAISNIFEEGSGRDVVVSALGWDRYDCYFRDEKNVFCLTFHRDTWDFYSVPGDFKLEDACVFKSEDVSRWVADFDRKVEESDAAWSFFREDEENRECPAERYEWENVTSIRGEVPSRRLEDVVAKWRNVQISYEEEMRNIAADALEYVEWLDDPESGKEGPFFLRCPIFKEEDIEEEDGLYNEELFDEILSSAENWNTLIV